MKKKRDSSAKTQAWYPARLTRRSNVGRLDKLAKLAKEVAHDLSNVSRLPITSAQERALFSALRALDMHNYYEEGDKLRKAFGVELDAIAMHKGQY